MANWTDTTPGARRGKYVYDGTVGGWKKFRSSPDPEKTTLIDGDALAWNATNNEVEGLGIQLSTGEELDLSSSERLNVHGALHADSVVANAINGTISGDIGGNAATATRLETSRTISLTGDISGQVAFDGTTNAVLSSTVTRLRDVPIYLGTGTPSQATRINLDGRLFATEMVSDFTGHLTGEADMATRLTNTRTIAIGGAVTGSVEFDGTQNVTITTTKNHTHAWSELTEVPASFTPEAHDHVWEDITNPPAEFPPEAHTHPTLTPGTGLSGSNYNGSTARTWSVDGTSTNTPSKVVVRDASGGFAAGAISASSLTLSGDLTVNGTTTAVNTTELTVQDNKITLNTDQQGTPSVHLRSGVVVNRGSETNYEFMFRESDQAFTVGQVGDEQAVATRQDSPGANAVPIWNASANRFDTTNMTISGSTITGSLSGNASSATQLQTARNINGVAFNGTSNITITANTPSTLTRGTGLTGNNFNGSAATTWSVAYGTSSTTACRGDDARLSDSRPANGGTSTSTNQVRGVNFHTGSTNPSGTTRLNMDGYFYATRVYNAVWNDIVDFIDTKETIDVEYGKVYCRDRDGHHYPADGYLASGILGIASDTYGFGVGHKSDIESTQLPIAIGGIVLAHVDGEYDTGTPLTATEGGALTEMWKEDRAVHPERIVATYYRPETDKTWNGIEVDGRHWVKIK